MRRTSGSSCSSRRTRSCAGRRRICRRRICRENDVPARPRAGRRRDPRHGDVPGAQDRSPALLPVARRPGHRRRAGPRPTGPTRCSTPTATTPSSATGSWPTRPAKPASRWPSGRRGGSAPANGWWSAFGKKRGTQRQEARRPPVHDDLVQRDFTADAPNQLWLADITEHWTGEGKLYLCAIKDVYSNRIVGYSIDSRMKSRLAVAALGQRRRPPRDGADVAGCIAAHRPRVASSDPGSSSHAPDPPRMVGSMGQVGAAGDNAAMESLLLPAAEERPRPPPLGHPRRAADRDRHLDRTHLPPTPPASRPRPIDPHRIRDDHDHNRHPGGLTQPVTRSCSRPQLWVSDRDSEPHVSRTARARFARQRIRWL